MTIESVVLPDSKYMYPGFLHTVHVRSDLFRGFVGLRLGYIVGSNSCCSEVNHEGVTPGLQYGKGILL